MNHYHLVENDRLYKLLLQMFSAENLKELTVDYQMFHAKYLFFKLVQHQGVIHVGNIRDINLYSHRN